MKKELIGDSSPQFFTRAWIRPRPPAPPPAQRSSPSPRPPSPCSRPRSAKTDESNFPQTFLSHPGYHDDRLLDPGCVPSVPCRRREHLLQGLCAQAAAAVPFQEAGTGWNWLHAVCCPLVPLPSCKISLKIFAIEEGRKERDDKEKLP